MCSLCPRRPGSFRCPPSVSTETPSCVTRAIAEVENISLARGVLAVPSCGFALRPLAPSELPSVPIAEPRLSWSPRKPAISHRRGLTARAVLLLAFVSGRLSASPSPTLGIYPPVLPVASPVAVRRYCCFDESLL